MSKASIGKYYSNETGLQNVAGFYSNETGLQNVAGTLPDCCNTKNVFNGDCYLARYPDVAADGKYNTAIKAYAHWLNFGQYEGRIPGCDPAPDCDCAAIGPGGGGDVIPGDTAGGGVMDFINKNPLIVAVVSGLIIYAVTKKVRTVRRKRR